MTGSTYEKETYQCHQCPGGYCEVNVYSEDNFDIAPSDCLYKSVNLQMNIKVKPIWVKV